MLCICGVQKVCICSRICAMVDMVLLAAQSCLVDNLMTSQAALPASALFRQDCCRSRASTGCIAVSNSTCKPAESVLYMTLACRCSGPLPNATQVFPEARVINVAYNRLTGSIPATFSTVGAFNTSLVSILGMKCPVCKLDAMNCVCCTSRTGLCFQWHHAAGLNP